MILILTQIILAKQSSNPIKSSFDISIFQGVTGKYTDSEYLKSRSIPQSNFFASSTGDKDGFPLSNLFINNTKYWVSGHSNNDTFKSSIIINFTEPILLEAFILGSYYHSTPLTREFYGFPTKLKIYTSLNDYDQFSLHTIFTGTPIYPIKNMQFVFKKPVHCKRIQLEFSSVTTDFLFSKGSPNAVLRYLNLIRSFGYDNLTYGKLDGRFKDPNYVISRQIPASKFKYSSTGDKKGHPISSVFEKKLSDSFWVSDRPNSDTFHSSIYVSFKDPVILESFIVAAANQKDNNHYFDGYPAVLGLYVSDSAADKEIKLHSLFYGSPDESSNRFQFVLSKPVVCSKLQLEFVNLISGGSASVSEIIFLQRVSNRVSEIESFSAMHVTKNFEKEKVTNLSISHVTLAGDDSDYLFVVEKKFDFEDVNFSCSEAAVSAIRSEEVSKVTVSRCAFDSCRVKNRQVDGGAIYARNCGFRCERSDFRRCNAKEEGSGGGVYFVIDKHLDDVADSVFEKCSFSGCRASRGAALFLHSNIESKPITIEKCVFVSNSLFQSEFSDGSAIYVNAFNCVVKDCNFNKNYGFSSLKIIQPTTNELFELSSVSVCGCQFKINGNSKSSLSCFGTDLHIDIKKCTFTGKPSEGAHHIHIDSFPQNSSLDNIKINFCKFSTDMKNSINLDFFDFNSPVFNLADKDKQKNVLAKNIFKILLEIMFLLVGVLIAAAIVIIISINMREPDNSNVQHNLTSEEI